MVGEKLSSEIALTTRFPAVRATARPEIDLFEDAGLPCPCCGSGSCLGRAA